MGTMENLHSNEITASMRNILLGALYYSKKVEHILKKLLQFY